MKEHEDDDLTFDDLEGLIPKHLMKIINKHSNIIQDLVNEEKKTGKALVDVQNWLSKEGKTQTETINNYIRTLLTKHKVEMIE